MPDELVAQIERIYRADYRRFLLGFVVLFCGFLTLTYVGFYGFTSLVATVRRGD